MLDGLLDAEEFLRGEDFLATGLTGVRFAAFAAAARRGFPLDAARRAFPGAAERFCNVM